MHQKVLGKNVRHRVHGTELLIALPFLGKPYMNLKTRLWKSISNTFP